MFCKKVTTFPEPLTNAVVHPFISQYSFKPIQIGVGRRVTKCKGFFESF